jgi:hypothetical protein
MPAFPLRSSFHNGGAALQFAKPPAAPAQPSVPRSTPAPPPALSRAGRPGLFVSPPKVASSAPQSAVPKPPVVTKVVAPPVPAVPVATRFPVAGPPKGTSVPFGAMKTAANSENSNKRSLQEKIKEATYGNGSAAFSAWIAQLRRTSVGQPRRCGSCGG